MASPRESSKQASAPFLMNKPALGRTFQVILDTSYTSFRALPQLLLGATILFMRFVVNIPAAATEMDRVGARRPHMVGVAMDWGEK